MSKRNQNDEKTSNKRPRVGEIKNEVKNETRYTLTPISDYPESTVNNFTYGCVSVNNYTYSKEFLQRFFHKFAILKDRFIGSILTLSDDNVISFNILVKMIDVRVNKTTYKNDIGKSFVDLMKLIYQYDSVRCYDKLKQIMSDDDFTMEIQDLRGACDYCFKIKNKEFIKIISSKFTPENIEYDILEKYHEAYHEAYYFHILLEVFLKYDGYKTIKMSNIHNTGCLNKIIASRNRSRYGGYPNNVYVKIRFE
jgi:hypothetical protein